MMLRWPDDGHAVLGDLGALLAGAGDGIPVHKLCSNDGWLVTPGECRKAVAMWHEACKEAGAGDEQLGLKVLTEALDEFNVGSDYWLKWIAWIERAAGHGGFVVR
jgi:hypothetical protein